MGSDPLGASLDLALVPGARAGDSQDFNSKRPNTYRTKARVLESLWEEAEINFQLRVMVTVWVESTWSGCSAAARHSFNSKWPNTVCTKARALEG